MFRAGKAGWAPAAAVPALGGGGGLASPWRGGDRHGSEELLSEYYAEGAKHLQRRLGQCSKAGTSPQGDKRDASFKSGSRVSGEIPGEGVPCPPHLHLHQIGGNSCLRMSDSLLFEDGWGFLLRG